MIGYMIHGFHYMVCAIFLNFLHNFIYIFTTSVQTPKHTWKAAGPLSGRFHYTSATYWKDKPAVFCIACDGSVTACLRWPVSSGWWPAWPLCGGVAPTHTAELARRQFSCWVDGAIPLRRCWCAQTAWRRSSFLVARLCCSSSWCRCSWQGIWWLGRSCQLVSWGWWTPWWFSRVGERGEQATLS